MNQLVIGMGEVGTAVKKVTNSEYSYDKEKGRWPKIKQVDVLHICFPYFDGFEQAVKDYIKRAAPAHIIVWSTVPIGTCRRIDARIVHSPVEGVHPRLKQSLDIMRRYVGYNKGSEGRFFRGYFGNLFNATTFISNTETTELLKLRSTAKYGINLVWAQYESELCERYGVEYTNLMDFDKEYNELYQRLGFTNTQRYVLFEPDGEIGGHCVVPNAKMLNEQMPSDLLDKIIAMEKK